MAINSIEKGKRGEREAAKFLNDMLGTSARRGQQRSGVDVADIIDAIPGLHIEVKRRATAHVIWPSYTKAIRRAPSFQIPQVVGRSDGGVRWRVIPASDLPRLARGDCGFATPVATVDGAGAAFWSWAAQADEDAQNDDVPCVMFRPNGDVRWAFAFPILMSPTVAYKVRQVISRGDAA